MVSRTYRLTEEGKEYLEKGLPEKRLVELLKQDPSKFMRMEDAIKRIKNFSIALKWASDKGWVERKGNGLLLVKLPEEFPEQEALEKINKGKEVSQELLETLLQRKLAEKVVVSEVDKLIGKEVTNLTPELIKTGIWKQVKFKPYDVNLVVPKIQPGKVQPYRQIIDDVRERLIGLGFSEVRGPLIETSFWNCDALFMPQDHPARGIHDIFFVKEPKYGKILDKNLLDRVKQSHENGWITGSKGWGGRFSFDIARRLLLRSHTTTLTSRTLSKLKKEDIPTKVFTIGRVFRPDVIDAKHFIEFDHCEGMVVGDGLNLRHLLGYLKEIATAIGAEKVRFKPSYFPFTEGSTELVAYIRGLGWIECAGAGIFRPEMVLPLGVEVPVLGWSIGIGRLAMLKLRINDIRYLYSDDLEWLRNKSMVR